MWIGWIALAQASGPDPVEEIVRGVHVRSAVGVRSFVGERSTARGIGPGTALGLGLGVDVVDRERFVVSVGAQLEQSLHRGPDIEVQVERGQPPELRTQGDLFLVGGSAVVEAVWFPTRRIGIGPRVSGGMLAVPLVAQRSTYNGVAFPNEGEEAKVPLHDAVWPTVSVGPTLAWYTKLAHFAVVADGSVDVTAGVDPGFRLGGGLEYTF